jgi:molybdenum cofactor biosynthesis protein B
MLREKNARRRSTGVHIAAMSVHSHRADAPRAVRFALVTISDTRTEADDKAGAAAKMLVSAGGHTIIDQRILPDEPDAVAAHVRSIASDVDIVVTMGGTGITARDRTFEALSALFTRTLPGFGEIFRALSYADIGAAAMLSRATAGTIGRAIVFACPGSTGAVTLALEKLILPEAGHVVREATR